MQDRPPPIERGSPAFWRANVALFLSAFSVFALLYSVQPILPILADEFGLDAAASSLALSATTAILAVALLFASWVGGGVDRKTLMMTTMVVSALLGLLVPLMPDWWTLVGVRALLGLTLSGVPAIAMVYLAEEMSPDGLGVSMGLYIGGTAIGGMSGRLLVGIIADVMDWRAALLALGLLVLVNALVFLWLLPAPRRTREAGMGLATLGRAVATHFRDKAIPLLYLQPFLLMGAFVTLYNYIGFRLLGPPYHLSQTAISFIFVVYLVGTLGSAWIGALSGRLGRRRVFWVMIVLMLLGMGLTLFSSVLAVVLGLAIVTFGFFAAHSVGSAWVTKRAPEGKSQAAAIYLFSYYMGSSALGTLGGYGWTWAGWTGVLAVAGGATLLALLLAWRLYLIPPLFAPDAASGSEDFR